MKVQIEWMFGNDAVLVVRKCDDRVKYVIGSPEGLAGAPFKALLNAWGFGPRKDAKVLWEPTPVPLGTERWTRYEASMTFHQWDILEAAAQGGKLLVDKWNSDALAVK